MDTGVLRVHDGGSLARVAGMAASAAERWDDAFRWFELAMAHSERNHIRFDAPAIWHRYAEMLARRGDPADDARALELATAALDGYREMGIVVYARDAERLVASLR